MLDTFSRMTLDLNDRMEKYPFLSQSTSRLAPQFWIVRRFLEFACWMSFLIHPLALSATPSQKAFKLGEHLHYTVKWGRVQIGYARMLVQKKIRYKGIECFLFQTKAGSVGLAKKIYPVHDTVTSYWDINGKRSLFAEKDLQEGNYFRHVIVHFDPLTNSATWKKKTYSGNTNKLGGKAPGVEWKYHRGVTKNLPVVVNDMLSIIYYNRSYSGKAKERTVFYNDVFDDTKLTRIKMQTKKREIIRLKINKKWQKISTIVVEPQITTSGIFKSTGRILVWTEDKNPYRLLMIKVKVPIVGNIRLRLNKTENIYAKRNSK